MREQVHENERNRGEGARAGVWYYAFRGK